MKYFPNDSAKQKLIDEKYIIIDELGEGGFGKVYKVRHFDTNEIFALKICTSENDEYIRRFSREIRLTEQIKHENIIPIVDYNIENSPPYYVMPLARASLENEINNFRGNIDEVIRVFILACKGIQATHDSGKIHRDIKPANILILEDGQVVISDFGLGKFEERDSTILTSSRVYMGTEGYLPPEYMTAGGIKNADFRGDVYQLGKTLYNLLTGNNPAIIDLNQMDKSIGFIISKATKPTPEERYQTTKELIRALESYQISREPKLSPEKSFNKVLNEIKAGNIDDKKIKEIFHILLSVSDDHITFLGFFDIIPEKIISHLSKKYSDELTILSKQYFESLDHYFSNSRYDFSYAEKVGSTFDPIYKNSSDLELKCISLRIILHAAVRCNRFATIDQFYEILKSINQDEEAIAVVEVLETEIDLFSVIYETGKDLNFHPVIKRLFKRIKESKREYDKNTEGDIFKF
jgi:serine/threonine protein kinase